MPKENKMKEEKSSCLASGLKVSLNSLLTSLQFYFSRMEMILGEPRRKDSKDNDISEDQKLDDAK